MRIHIVVVVVIAMVVLTGPFDQALSSGTGRVLSVETPIPDVPVTIRNGPKPSGGVITLRMEQLWRAGGDEEEYLFGLICDALADRKGNILLLDKQLADVKVFSPEGEYLKTLSREGQGPGEVQQPTGLILLDRGGLGIVQGLSPPKIVWLDDEGHANGSWGPHLSEGEGPGLGIIRSAEFRNGRFVASCSMLRMMKGQPHEVSMLTRFDRNGTILVRYYEVSKPLGSKPDADCDLKVFKAGGWDVDSRGRVYSVQGCGEYRITVQDSTGAPSMIIEREHKRRRRSPEEMKRIADEYRITEGVRRDKEIQVAEYAPAIASIRVAANDELWVLPDRPCTERENGVLAEYDVFAPTGEFVRQVRIVGDGDCAEDSWHFVSDDRLILVRGYESSLAAYRAAVLKAAGMEERASQEGEGQVEIICFALRPES